MLRAGAFGITSAWPGAARHDVQEREGLVVLVDLVAGSSPRRIFAKMLSLS